MRGAVKANRVLTESAACICIVCVAGGAALASEGRVHTAVLEYQEVPNAISWSTRGLLNIATQAVVFAKEPDLGAGRVVRGLLAFGKDTNNWVPFGWNRDQEKLWLDLNRNRDLTDDPEGFISALKEGSPLAYYQVYPGVRLTFVTPTGPRRALVNLQLARPDSFALWYAHLRSFWQTRLSLQGREWQIGLVEEPPGPDGPPEPAYLLLRPWEARGRPIDLNVGTPDLIDWRRVYYQPRQADGPPRALKIGSIDWRRVLYLPEQAYRIQCRQEARSGTAGYTLELTETPVELGNLRVTGECLYRLVLEGLDGHTVAVLDAPGAVTKAPAGAYRVRAVWLRKGEAEGYSRSDKAVVVGERGTTSLVAGGPLQNSLTLSRWGKFLFLRHRIAGADGSEYRLLRRDRDHPPEWAAYRNGQTTATGKFAFG